MHKDACRNRFGWADQSAGMCKNSKLGLPLGRQNSRTGEEYLNSLSGTCAQLRLARESATVLEVSIWRRFGVCPESTYPSSAAIKGQKNYFC